MGCRLRRAPQALSWPLKLVHGSHDITAGCWALHDTSAAPSLAAMLHAGLPGPAPGTRYMCCHPPVSLPAAAGGHTAASPAGRGCGHPVHSAPPAAGAGRSEAPLCAATCELHQAACPPSHTATASPTSHGMYKKPARPAHTNNLTAAAPPAPPAPAPCSSLLTNGTHPPTSPQATHS